MTTPPNTITSGALIDPSNEASAAERRRRWFELCLVLLVACGGYLVRSLYFLLHGPSVAPQFSSFTWAGGIVHQTTALLLLGYVLSRRGLSFAYLGLRWSPRDVGMSLLVIIVSYSSYLLGHALIQTIHQLMYGTWFIGPTAKDFFPHPSLATIPFLLLNPFFEELIVRAYVMTEVIELTGSSALAVALSVGVQFSYHLYYGWVGAISLSFFFFALALYFARSRCALPVIAAHGFFDLYALIRAW